MRKLSVALKPWLLRLRKLAALAEEQVLLFLPQAEAEKAEQGQFAEGLRDALECKLEEERLLAAEHT